MRGCVMPSTIVIMEFAFMPVVPSRRAFAAGLALLLPLAARASGRPEVVVYKSPSCGCCQGWVDHIRKAGHAARIVERDDLAPVKARARIPEALQSCHTAFVEGYAIEGHVPAEAIARLLAERPAILGLAVPGMPAGTPGMEVAGAAPEPFSVMAIPLSGAPAPFMDYSLGYRRAAG